MESGIFVLDDIPGAAANVFVLRALILTEEPLQTARITGPELFYTLAISFTQHGEADRRVSEHK